MADSRRGGCAAAAGRASDGGRARAWAAAVAMPLAMRELDIIVVNWNAGPMLARSVASIAGAIGRGVQLDRLVIVDNGSSDASVEALPRGPLPLTVIENGENRGFAAACNQGAAGSRADYLLFLNPDVVLEPDSIAVPLSLLESQRGRGIAVAGIQLMDARGTVARTCGRFPGLWHFVNGTTGLNRLSPRWFPARLLSEWDHGSTRIVDQVSGACFLVRRTAFEALHGFDERFVLYLEDLDFSKRARAAGWLSIFVAEARAFHRSGWSAGSDRPLRLLHAWRSQVIYGWAHFGWWRAAGLTACTALIAPFARLGLALCSRSPTDARDAVEAMLRFWRDLPSLVGRPERRSRVPAAARA